ncbi:hypothetical protein K503DRAFT_775082 [Rhizopogon vinicolor AM-OR11-026]|uniref:Uncharacterized protein n=1 Tax=Rhizopogon vinicolor AM-OR11-026 TaxID=1314800 RepID=A0A1B7MMV2_9AGAM|nr:hypothetical protein K503DRAFT_775082 [Rhizopogon vinicolor AM-OR11-026]
MSVPTYSIHSIHGTFAGASSYSKFSHAGIVIEASQIDKIPPGLARAAWRTAPVLILPPSTRRAPPPPPPRLLTSQSIPFPSEDPFNDSNLCTIPIPRRPTLQRTHSASQSYTVRLPSSNPIDALLRQRTAQRAAMER